MGSKQNHLKTEKVKSAGAEVVKLNQKSNKKQKDKSFFKRYFLYLIRWQLSTPILAVCVVFFANIGATWSTIIANFIGGLIFFWVDRIIFQSTKLGASWQVREEVKCVDCGAVSRGYRLVKSKNYDRANDENPQFRCEKCSQAKAKKLAQAGVEV